MTPKKNRLTKETIKTTLKFPKRISSDFFLVLYKDTGGSTPPQISFVASKKIAKTAVLRNRLRRKGYNAVKPLITKVFPGFVALIQYKKDIQEEKTEAIRDDIKRMLSDAGALKQ